MKILASLVFVSLVACGGGNKPSTTTTKTDDTMGSAQPVEKQPEVAAGSGSAEEAKQPPPEEKKEEPPPPPPPPPEPDAFLKLTKDEKMKIMKTKVLPAMAKAFKAHDAKAFAKVTCKTCHGKGAEGDYKMPNPDLPQLDWAAIKEGKQNPKMVEFMEKTVKPEMIKMLGVAGMDKDHPNGFGCTTCHTSKP